MWSLRSDAKAEGEKIVIGGYATHDASGQPLEHKNAAWFMVELNRTSAPFRTIASLELLGTLISIMVLMKGEVSNERFTQCGTLSVGALTDNLGNRFAVAKLLTTKWPLAAFLVELSCQLESRGLLLDMHWVPRDQNSEADAITNGDVHWLSADREIKVDLKEMKFELLHQLLEQGEVFYQGIEAVNAEDDVEALVRKTPIKVRDPWDR